MAALRLAASRVNPALESGRAEEGCALYETLYNRGVALCFLKEPHINAPVRRRHGVALCPQGVQAQTRALLIPGFHGIQAVGAQPGNMAGLYGAAYQVLQTGLGEGCYDL